jgi:hypothetical protein
VISQVLRVAWYRLRATFGRRWGGYLGLVLLIGLIGGIALGAGAAARRTESSFPVFLASTNPSDLTVQYASAYYAGLPAFAASAARRSRPADQVPARERADSTTTRCDACILDR